ncbi:S1C family serine protease [[Clostridium] polysaccharolyticum]|uniref:Serine protease, S1-C subfamily, contains C-terminal PDZ domain n=1 Tax=[Clostridium] polysaccharolyticum TaxID=29364 RepID=A0A1I0EA31_9FIRM|nr:PDZ domain-containing protein [[Clostridium] polysaccharolyticum]SET41245.1 serine protease, S1-C subfamily, contains C-terminal PDZ domain [[Clostridium] polysaccharolyticum]
MKVENRDQHKEEYSFIQETIVPRTKNTRRKLMKNLGCSILMGIVFGFVSSIVFHISNEFFGRQEQLEEQKKIVLEDEKQLLNELTVTQPPKQNEKEPPSSLDKEITDLDIYHAYDMKSYQKSYYLMRSLSDKFKYSIVTVDAVKDATSWFDKENKESSYGFILRIDHDYTYIMCNYDKIKNANKIQVRFYNGDEVRVKQVDYHKETSIAVIKVKTSSLTNNTKQKIEKIRLGDSYQLGRGIPVLGLGSPDGTMNSIAIGYVTAPCIDRYIVDGKLDLFHTSITENPYGDGFFVDMDGKVVGIITHKFKDDTDQNIMSFLGISKLRPILTSLLKEKEMASLGVKVSELSSKSNKSPGVKFGIYIADVVANSPAFKKGLRAGDIITEIDGVSVSSATALMNKLSDRNPGDKMEFTIIRQTKEGYPQVKSEKKNIVVTLK